MIDQSEKFWREFFPSAFGLGDRFIPGVNQLLQPEGLAANDVRRWIKHHSDHLEMTPTQWARWANLAPSTLNRFLKETGPASLKADTIEALVQVLVERAGEMAMRRYGEKPPEFSTRHSFGVDVIAILNKEASKKFEWAASSQYRITIPIPRDALGPPTFGIEIGNYEVDGMRDGDIILAIPSTSNFSEVVDGQKYLFHERLESGAVSTVIRRLTVDPHGDKWLVRLSEDDTSRALHFADFQKGGFNERFMASLAVIGTIKTESWLPYRRC